MNSRTKIASPKSNALLAVRRNLNDDFRSTGMSSNDMLKPSSPPAVVQNYGRSTRIEEVGPFRYRQIHRHRRAKKRLDGF